MSGTEEQLISFFLYSMFIYPVTNYLVSPKRSYARWKGAVFAVLFLAVVSVAHMVYENREKGPNHYILLGVTRKATTSTLKKAYRNLSLELHPDKNKSPTAPEEFRKVKQAFDVITNLETRDIYDRLGDAGVKVAAQTVIDHKYIIIQMLVYYTSSLIFAFLMTFSEASGDAMNASFFGLIALLLVEYGLVLQQVEIPVWLLPYHTSHDIVSLLHRLYPAYMNGCRCIIGSFVVDHKAQRLEAMQELSDATRAVTVKSVSVVQSAAQAIRAAESMSLSPNGVGGLSKGLGLAVGSSSTTMADFLHIHKSANTQSVVDMVQKKAALIADPRALSRKDKASGTDYTWVRNLAIYLAARYLLVKTPGVTTAAK